MKCPSCTANPTKYVKHNGTHIWSCPDCSLVMFEFYTAVDVRHLSEYLEVVPPIVAKIDKEVKNITLDEITYCQEDGREDLLTEDGDDFVDIDPQTREENLIWSHGYIAGLERAKSMLSK